MTVVWSGGETTRHEVRARRWAGTRAPMWRWSLGSASWRSGIPITGSRPGSTTRVSAPAPASRGPMPACIRCASSMASRPAARCSTRGAAPRADGLVPIAVAAERLGVSPSLVHVWVRHGVLRHDQHRSASRVWVRLDADDLARLNGSSQAAPGLPSFAEVQANGTPLAGGLVGTGPPRRVPGVSGPARAGVAVAPAALIRAGRWT